MPEMALFTVRVPPVFMPPMKGTSAPPIWIGLFRVILEFGFISIPAARISTLDLNLDMSCQTSDIWAYSASSFQTGTYWTWIVVIETTIIPRSRAAATAAAIPDSDL